MYDQFNRRIHYLRISVTDRCNLRCYYCMPESGVEMLQHEDILSFEEIIEVVSTGAKSGIDKIRITGGEPLVRKGLINLISGISQIPAIKDLAMTTNGVLLSEYAQSLKDAGLQRVNISLDTMDANNFRQITRGGNIQDVLNGIEAAKKAGLFPIKINCVVINSPSDKDAHEVGEFGRANGLEVRFIHMMSLREGKFSVVEGGSGGDCEKCGRLRLTADGKLKPCLFSNLEYDVRKLGSEEAFKRAVSCKPESGSVNDLNLFHNIGG
jgi:GTP 3',8-cyclase